MSDRDIRTLERAVKDAPYDNELREKLLGAKARTGDPVAIQALRLIYNHGISAVAAHRISMGVVPVLSFASERRIYKAAKADPSSKAGRAWDLAARQLSPGGAMTDSARAVKDSFNSGTEPVADNLGPLAWRPINRRLDGRKSEEQIFIQSLNVAAQVARVALRDAWIEVGGRVKIASPRVRK